MPEQPRYLKIGRTDNVGVALADLAAGESPVIDGCAVTLTEPVGRGHKFALRPIAAGEPVVKYDMPIGRATRNIAPGGFVHIHNLRTNLSGELEYTYEPVPAPALPEVEKKRTFKGFRRADGTAGIRNDLWIIPTVGCVNKLAENLARDFERGHGVRTFAFPHPYGCSQLGGDHETTANLLAALVKHPNAGGVLVVALGCENNTLESFRQRLGSCDLSRVRFLKAQDDGSEYDLGLELLEELAANAAKCERVEIPVSELKVGLKCGGSDGLSGITANPLIGRFSDLLAAAGGTTVLTEVPEMFGAETLLFNRCRDEETFRRAVAMVNGFKEYFLRHGQVVYENPSPGNKAGGISTLEEKSLGCTQKGGTSQVTDVLGYGEALHTPGLNLLTGPGNDMVAVTVLAAAGAQLVLFSTGRGTPFGGPVPTVKISTNTELAERKPNWIDFDAGRLVKGKGTLDGLGEELFDYVIALASGEIEARNELYGYREIAIFKDGVTL
ncbi:MAG: altronate dehydratase [Lentisphaeria bacterium]|nr:altronate dehydratase [Lentisphaeria bacterium]